MVVVDMFIGEVGVDFWFGDGGCGYCCWVVGFIVVGCVWV